MRITADNKSFIKELFLWILAVVFVFFLVALKTTVMQKAAIFRASIDPAFVFCIVLSTNRYSKKTVWISFVSGLILDAVSGTFFLNAFLYAYISYGCGRISEAYFKKSILFTASLVFLGTVLLYMGTALIKPDILKSIGFFDYTIKIALPNGLANAVISPLFCLLIKKKRCLGGTV